jgi:L-amino acid N-acyltransferase YncA
MSRSIKEAAIDHSIRDAQPDDLPAIVGIYNATVPDRLATADLEPVTPESRLSWLARHSPERRPLWVVERDDAVVAWLSFESFYGRPAYAGTAEISIYVAKEQRREGIGRELLVRAIEAAPALQLRTLLAFVFAHNEASVALFESNGFDRWGRLPRVARMDGIERDVLILGRRIEGAVPSIPNRSA